MTTHTHIGETANGKPVALTRDERLRHMAIFGSTGVGKTTFLLNIVSPRHRPGRWTSRH